MRRNIRSFISLKSFKYLFYIPVIIFKISNWLPFILNYLGLKNEANIYQFRNGIKIKTENWIDAITILVIFIKKDYGIIKNDSIVIDIGSNIGIFSIYAALTSKNSTVYAYEPLVESYNLSVENIILNKAEKSVFPFKLGVGAKKEIRKMFLADSSQFHSLYNSDNKNNSFLEINIVSLKDVFDSNNLKHCDILKIDCEGAEFEILYNTPSEYLKYVKEIRLEYHNQKEDGYNINKLIKYLENNQFALIRLRRDSAYLGNAWFQRV